MDQLPVDMWEHDPIDLAFEGMSPLNWDCKPLLEEHSPAIVSKSIAIKVFVTYWFIALPECYHYSVSSTIRFCALPSHQGIIKAMSNLQFQWSLNIIIFHLRHKYLWRNEFSSMDLIQSNDWKSLCFSNTTIYYDTVFFLSWLPYRPVPGTGTTDEIIFFVDVNRQSKICISQKS